MFNKKYLPIGDADIRNVIRSGFYVDKTAYAYELLQGSAQFVFLARPRRFGKSLFMSTLAAICSGEKDLFKNCFIGNPALGYDWPKYPVIQLSLAGIDHNSPDCLKQELRKQLYAIGQLYGIALEDPDKELTINSYLGSLVFSLTKLAAYAPQVVVLIDEYEASFINLPHGTLKEENRQVVRDLLTVIKRCAGQGLIKLEFVTGVSAYCFNSLNSGPNNLKDITLSPRYATIAGYTEEELFGNASVFQERLQGLAGQLTQGDPEKLAAQLRYWYNGYQFFIEVPKVYNPFSILRFLEEGIQANYWINTGTPTFLLHKAHEKTVFDVDVTQPIVAKMSALVAPKEDQLTTLGEMFQGGYLTIDRYQDPEPLDASGIRTDEDLILLRFPNKEVELSFYNLLKQEFERGVKQDTQAHAPALVAALQAQDLENFIGLLYSCFAAIPYHISKVPKDEAYYHTIFHSFLHAMNLYPVSEYRTHTGRIDMVVTSLPKSIYIFEFKYGQSARIALEQIQARAYAAQFLHRGKDVIIFGINFSADIRNIEDWEGLIYNAKGEELRRLGSWGE